MSVERVFRGRFQDICTYIENRNVESTENLNVYTQKQQVTVFKLLLVEKKFTNKKNSIPILHFL